MREPFVDLGFARVDTDRRRRCGFPEVIFGQGKTAEQVLDIGRTILAHEPVLLVSRANEAQFSLLRENSRRRISTSAPAALPSSGSRCRRSAGPWR
jgi:NCAIR mutase (PurE)-related protein